MKTQINITATNVEQFKNIEEALNKLPEKVRDQIESAKSGIIGLECIIKDKYTKNQTIFLPNKTTQINDFDDYTGIYCGKYFFKLIGNLYKEKHNFVFIECNDI